MENSDLILSRIRSLEAQLRVLQAMITPRQSVSNLSHSFAELYGRLRGKVESSEEEITAVLYELPEDANNADRFEV